MNEAIATAFRNLYSVSNGADLVGFVTESCAEKAAIKYRQNGGNSTDPTIKQMTFGYPEDVCNIWG